MLPVVDFNSNATCHNILTQYRKKFLCGPRNRYGEPAM
jgi:hypothetical protein